MKLHIFRYIPCFAFLLLISCTGSKKQKESEGGVATVLPETQNTVSVMTLTRQDFHHELVSNGKVTAAEQADLRFESSEVIVQIYVKNGDRVKKGQKLAELDKFNLNNRLIQAEDALERTRLELQDILIGQGYVAGDFSKVPEETMKLAEVKSGYTQSRVQYELAKRELERATLVAPLDGVVANLFTRSHNWASISEVFCSIIGTQNMEVDFSVLESELPLLSRGDRVRIIPYAGAESVYEGTISAINPLVDTKGMVKVKARVNADGRLFCGMNVRVIVQRSLGKLLVIPKSAVVLRSGRQVVFTLKDGKACWNYVQTGLENTDSYVVSDKANAGVTDGLSEGDVVIVSGNVNLAHETPVTVLN